MMKKAEAERLFVEHLSSVGIKSWCKTYERGNWYYCFWLKNGETRYWTSLSEKSEIMLGLNKERGANDN